VWAAARGPRQRPASGSEQWAWLACRRSGRLIPGGPGEGPRSGLRAKRAPERSDGPRLRPGRAGATRRCFRGDGVGGPQGGGGQGEAGCRRRGHRTTPGLSLGAFYGLSIHWWLPNLGGLERDPAFNEDWAGWEQPWRCGLPKLVRLGATWHTELQGAASRRVTSQLLRRYRLQWNRAGRRYAEPERLQGSFSHPV
jgi:hypothetical protein